MTSLWKSCCKPPGESYTKTQTRRLHRWTTFSRAYQIERVLEVAARLGQAWQILECVCADETVRARLDIQANGQHPAGNRTFGLYRDIKQRFEPITLPKTIIDTDRPFEQCVSMVLATCVDACWPVRPPIQFSLPA